MTVAQKHIAAQSAKHFIDTLKNLTETDWNTIPDIGPVVAKSLADYFHSTKQQEFIHDLLTKGVVISFPTKPQVTTEGVTGKVFVFTGSMANLTRDEAQEKVRSLGGEISESVGKQTDYVVAGTDPGSKYSKAQKLGIPTLTEDQFQKLIS